MKILKEDTAIKEILPVSFLTDMISKGWEEVGYLRESSVAIRETYKDTSKIEALMQDLMDAYLVFIGQIETYLEDKENISADSTEETPAVKTEVNNTAELPEAEIEIEPIDSTPEINPDIEPESETDVDYTTSGEIATSGDFDEFAISDQELETKREPIEPFEFFVDFEEPDMSEPRLSDEDLYGHEDSEFEQNKLKAQLMS